MTKYEFIYHTGVLAHCDMYFYGEHNADKYKYMMQFFIHEKCSFVIRVPHGSTRLLTLYLIIRYSMDPLILVNSSVNGVIAPGTIIHVGPLRGAHPLCPRCHSTRVLLKEVGN